jgi:hypothetical protein
VTNRRTYNKAATCNPWIAWLLALGVFFGFQPQLPAYTDSSIESQSVLVADNDWGSRWGEVIEFSDFSLETEENFESDGEDQSEDSAPKNSSCLHQHEENGRTNPFELSLITTRGDFPRGPKGDAGCSTNRYLKHCRLNI